MGYGRAGEFREQPHGFEYRVLSNFPLRHPTLAWIFHCLTRDAYYAVAMGLELYKHINMNDVEYAINFCDRDAAAFLWVDIKNLLKKHFFDKNRSYVPTSIMFQEESMRDLESVITQRPLTTHFKDISMYSWAPGVRAPGVNRYASRIVPTKMTRDFHFNDTWQFNTDNILRFT